MSKKLTHIIKLCIAVILITALCFFLYKKRHLIDIVTSKNLTAIGLIFISYIFNYLLLGIVNNYPLRRINITLPFSHWFGLTNLANLFNLVLPAKGGTAIRWYYLWEKYKVPTQLFMSLNFFGTAIGMISMGFLGLCASFALPLVEINIFTSLASAFALLLVAGICIVYVIAKISNQNSRFFSPLVRELKDIRVFIITAICFCGITLLYPIRTYISYKALGSTIDITQSIEISMIMLLISIVPILPGNLGVKEIAMAYSSKHFGISPEVAILASFIERIGLYLFLFPFGFAAYISVFSKVKKDIKITSITKLMKNNRT